MEDDDNITSNNLWRAFGEGIAVYSTGGSLCLRFEPRTGLNADVACAQVNVVLFQKRNEFAAILHVNAFSLDWHVDGRGVADCPPCRKCSAAKVNALTQEK